MTTTVSGHSNATTFSIYIPCSVISISAYTTPSPNSKVIFYTGFYGISASMYYTTSPSSASIITVWSSSTTANN